VHGLGELRHRLMCGHAVDVMQQQTDDGAMAFDHSPRTPVLPDVGIAPGLMVERLAVGGIALAKVNASLGTPRSARFAFATTGKRPSVIPATFLCVIVIYGNHTQLAQANSLQCLGYIDGLDHQLLLTGPIQPAVLALKNLVIHEVIDVPQIQQPGRYPKSKENPTSAFRGWQQQVCHLLNDTLPRHRIRVPDNCMVVPDNLIQTSPNEIIAATVLLITRRRSMRHPNPSHIARELPILSKFPTTTASTRFL